MAKLVINLVGFYAGWFACVLGAAGGHGWLGVAVFAALLALHLGLQRSRKAELLLAVAACGLGLVLESALIAAGVYTPKRLLLPAPLADVWLIAMWGNFALLQNASLRGLQAHLRLAAVLGALGGPLAFYSGERLGALALSRPLVWSLLALAAVWALAVPCLLRGAGLLRGRFPGGSGAG